MEKDRMIELSNGYCISDLCCGTGITQIYRYGDCSNKSAVKYWVKNAIKDRKRLKQDLALPKVVDAAMQNGCKLFDTSRAYGGSEYALGKTLKKYNRKDFFITTKLSNADQYKGDVRAALEKSLSELGVEYVDVYLMHWPVKDCFIENWKKMECLYKEGLCKSIGVCNFNIHHLQELEPYAEIMPMINQFECHPLFTQNELRQYCKEHDIQVMAYTSTARMDERLRKTALVPIANKYGKSVTQIILRWHQQIGNIPIVSSSKVAHFIENTSIADFNLTEQEVQQINDININSRLRYDPDNCDFRQL